MKVIVTFLVFLLCVQLSKAQTNYYTTSKTFYESGYTYQCDSDGSLVVKLYNRANRWTNIHQMIKGTNKPYYRSELGDGVHLHPYTSESYIVARTAIRSIISDVFFSYKESLKGRDLRFITCINSDTGKLDELYFKFSNKGPFATIPVSVYREAELRIKELQVDLTPFGKTLNYVYSWWWCQF